MVLLDNSTYEMHLVCFHCPEKKGPRHFFFTEVGLFGDFKWSTSKNTCMFWSKIRTRMSGIDPLLSYLSITDLFYEQSLLHLTAFWLPFYCLLWCQRLQPLQSKITAVSPPFRNIRINKASYLQFPARLLHRIQETIFSPFSFQEIVLFWYRHTPITSHCTDLKLKRGKGKGKLSAFVTKLVLYYLLLY